VRYWASGDGNAAALFIHGIGSFAEAWLMNFHPLSKDLRVYALDLPGYGYSDRPKLQYSIEFYAQFIERFLDQLHIDRITPVGNSFGGGVALQFANKFPQRVDKMVLASSVGFGTYVSLPFRLIGTPVIGRLILKPSRHEEQNRRRSIGILLSLLYNCDRLDPDMQKAMIDMYTEMSTTTDSDLAIRTLLRRYTSLFGIKKRYTREAEAILPTMKPSALIIWGENDPVLPVSDAYVGQRRLPDATLHVFEKCGHMPHIEYPERFNTLVRDFITCR
jgi:4,5:9,10-diseco-3-hydroxy-5,9,17-trioxoandrosta-1(10),2-diene-4-oate hydrolase